MSDLFNEGAVVWGAVPALLEAGFETLVEAGIDPQLAYLDACPNSNCLPTLSKHAASPGCAKRSATRPNSAPASAVRV